MILDVGPKLEARLLAPFAGRNRGKGVLFLVVEPRSSSSPTFRRVPGYTQWKNGRPRKYHRASYEVIVGSEWLASEYPRQAMEAALLGNDEIEISWEDELPSYAIPLKEREPSLDMEEDVRCFA